MDERVPKYPYQRVRQPTIKERRYVKNLLSPKSKGQKQAALDAGLNTPPRTDAVKSEIRRVMDKVGLSDWRLVQQLRRYIFKAKDEDNSVKALRMAFELKDLFPASRKTSDLTLAQINIYQGMDTNVLKERIRNLLERAGAEESEGRLVFPDEGDSGVQRLDGDIPQGTVSEGSVSEES